MLGVASEFELVSRPRTSQANRISKGYAIGFVRLDVGLEERHQKASAEIDLSTSDVQITHGGDDSEAREALYLLEIAALDDFSHDFPGRFDGGCLGLDDVPEFQAATVPADCEGHLAMNGRANRSRARIPRCQADQTYVDRVFNLLLVQHGDAGPE
jgi:hypothetical protein